MKFLRFLHLLAPFVVVTSISSRANSLPEPASLLADDFSALTPYADPTTIGKFESLKIEGMTFTQAIRYETLQRPPFPWDAGMRISTIAPILTGDTLLLQFRARCVATRQETGEALIGAVIETTGKLHEKLSESEVSVGPEWTLISRPFIADRDAAAGEIQLAFRLGYEPQTLEIADVRLLNYRSGVPLASLPATKASYEGIAPDHPWRAEAAERIERLRKGDLTITVRNAPGEPRAGVTIQVTMLRHAFAFGTAISASRIAGDDSPDNLRYREILEKHFNKVVFENDLKWPAWVSPGGFGGSSREEIFRALDWFDARQISVRGHVMVWPSWENTPEFLRALKDQPERLGAAVLDHIADQTSALGTRLTDWDVINESYTNHDLMDVLGRDVMADWFRAAHKGAPDLRLFYNDYLMFSGEGPGSPSQYFEDTIEFLVRKGAPIGGIGEQGHFGGSPASPIAVLAALNRFSRFGLPIQITEFDIDTADTELQVAYTRDFLTAVFSHPSVTGVLTWGFWEGRHWKPRAAFWDQTWNLRPHGAMWLDLITRQWWTNASLITDTDGRAMIRGFCGDYKITVTDSKGTTLATKLVPLPRSGAAVEIDLSR